MAGASTSADASGSQSVIKSHVLDAEDLKRIDEFCKKRLEPAINSREALQLQLQLQLQFDALKPAEDLAIQLHIPADKTLIAYYGGLYDHVNDGSVSYTVSDLLAAIKDRLRQCAKILTAADAEEFGNMEELLFRACIHDEKYTLACFQRRHRDAVKQASTQQPGTGHADEQMEEAEEQVDDAQHHEADEERGDDDLVLPAIKDYYKNDPDILVKVVQEHTLSKARKASGSKSRTDASRSSIDAGRSKNTDLFAGKPEHLGKQARDWLSSVEVYLDSVESERPVPKIATYFRGDAQEWWKTQGKAAVGLDATFAQFADAFLALFVKAADGRKARQELSEMKQGDVTVEAFAAQFRSCAARIVASKTGTAVDSTTQAGYFQNGLKRVILSKLQGTVEPEVMSDIDLLIDAAEKVEANLEMSKAAKNDRPVKRSQNSGNSCVQGNYVARNQHHARSFPYQRPQHSFNGGRGGRGPFGFGRGVNVVQALPPQEEEYAQFNAAVHDNSGKRCFACGEWGHIAAQCPNRAEQQAQ